MLTFLKMVLAVILVIALLIAAGWFWLKRRLKQAIGDFTVANDLLSELSLRPARVRLRRADYTDHGEAFQALVEDLKTLGFQRMADLLDDECAFKSMLAARHRELPIAAAVVEDHDEVASFVLFTIDNERKVCGRGNSWGDTIANARVDWQQSDDTTPSIAFEEIGGRLNTEQLSIDLKLYRAVYEQVYALYMDQQIVHAPTRESIARMTANLDEPATEEQIETALNMAVEHWKGQIVDASLDRYRRSSKIDAVTWEEQRDDIQVVHSRLDEDDIANLLVVDDVSERIFDQCIEQGLTGIDLFAAISERLPPDQQWTKVGEVGRPVRAMLYMPKEGITSDIPEARQYIFEAEDDSGNTVQSGVFARNSTDAKRQIANMGLRNAKLLIEPTAVTDGNDDMFVDDASAVIAAKSATQSTLTSVLGAVVSNWWIWAPPTALVGKSWLDGAPFGWGDYVVFAYAGIALLAMVFLIGPMIFYNQLLLAQLKARSKLARFWIGMLGLTGRFSGITKAQLVTEKSKSFAEEGRLDEALDLHSSIRPTVSEEEFQMGLVSIYSAAGEWSSMMEAQRAYLEQTPAKETATVDLAMSIARYCDDVEAAEPLIQDISPADLPEVTLIGYQYCRGLVAAYRGQHQQALNHYAQALETARQFESLPIMVGLIAEINGHAALALKRSGKADQAKSLWRKVFPVISVHRSSERLIDAYDKD